MGFFAVLAASLFAVFLFTVFGGYSLLLWCQQSLWMVVPPAVVLAVLVWTFLKMDDKITALQKRVEELYMYDVLRADRCISGWALGGRAAAPAAIRPAAPAPTTIRSLFIFAGFLHFLVYLVFLPDLLKFIEIL